MNAFEAESRDKRQDATLDGQAACMNNIPEALLRVAERFLKIGLQQGDIESLLDASEFFALAEDIDQALRICAAALDDFGEEGRERLLLRIGGLRGLKRQGAELHRLLIHVACYLQTGEGGHDLCFRALRRLEENGLPSVSGDRDRIQAILQNPLLLEEPIRQAFGRSAGNVFLLGLTLRMDDLGAAAGAPVPYLVRTARPIIVPIAGEVAFRALGLGVESGNASSARSAADRFLDRVLAEGYLKETRLHAAERLYELGDLPGAVAACTDHLSRKPRTPEAYRRRGIAWLVMGEIEAALSDFTTAISMDPGDDGSLWRRGGIYSDHLGDARKAMSDFSSSLRIDPYCAEALACRGITRFGHDGDVVGAVADLRLALRYEPSNPFPHYNLACVFLESRQHGDAIPHLDLCIDSLPGYAEAWVNRGLCHRVTGNLEQAIEDLTRGYELDPRLLNALWNRALAYRDHGREAEAVRDLKAYLELDSSSQFAQQAQSLLVELKG